MKNKKGESKDKLPIYAKAKKIQIGESYMVHEDIEEGSIHDGQCRSRYCSDNLA
jgi:hypothetical protein